MLHPHDSNPGDATSDLVAAALLRLGSDTRSARLFKEMALHLAQCSEGPVVDRLAAALGVADSERAARIADARAKAARATAAVSGRRLTVLTVQDPGYPPLLAEIIDPPIVCWVRGHVGVLCSPSVAVVGSRHASGPGLAVARTLGRGLAQVGLTVVSGLARGIDAAAHRGALEVGGRTVAVLGSGVDVVYPPEHESLAQEIEREGALVSEFPPGTRPYASHFPLRNRIISGLCRAVVVVEASERSGSLITARAALEQGRDVLAVPGTVLSGRYRGGHALIKDGARLVETVEDILDELGWKTPQSDETTSGDKSSISSLLEDANSVEGVDDVEALAMRIGRPVSEVLAELGALEVAGILERTPGGGFRRT